MLLSIATTIPRRSRAFSWLGCVALIGCQSGQAPGCSSTAEATSQSHDKMFDYDENCSRTYLSKNGQKLCAGPALRSDGIPAPKPDDQCPADPNKTAPGLCGCGVREPLDVAGYRDAQNYPCSDWAGFDCTRAAEHYGYTAAEEVSILENCAGSCNICPK